MNLMQFFWKYEKRILFGLAIFTAITFGVTGTMQAVFTRKADDYAGKILGKDISKIDFENWKSHCTIWTQSLTWYFQNYTGSTKYLSYQPPFDMLDMELYDKKRDDYMNQLTWVVLMENALAGKAGISVSPKEIVDYIKQDLPFFQEPKDKDKKDSERIFSQERYLRLLELWHVPDALFEQVVGEFLKINKYRTMVLSSITANNEEAYKEFLIKYSEIRLNWAAFNPPNFEKKIEVKSDEELSKYFDEHQQDYEVVAKVQIESMMATLANIEKEVQIPEETLQSQYNKNRDKEYPLRAYAEVRDEIRAKVASQEANDQSLERINKAEEKMAMLELQEKKIDFNDIAKEFNLNYKITPLVNIDEVKEFEKDFGTSKDFEGQASSLGENDISRKISTDKGYFIFRIAKKQEKYIPKFDDQIKAKVKKDYIAFRADEAAKAAADKLAKDINDKVTAELKDKPDDENLKRELSRKWFEAMVTEDKDIKMEKTEFFSKTDSPALPKPYGISGFKDELFDKKTGDFGVFSNTGIYYLAQVADRRAPDPEKLDSELKSVQSSLTSKKKSEFIKKWFEEMKKQTGWEDYSKQSKQSA